jgi:two-component system chemotaxis sensor kinase CheA
VFRCVHTIKGNCGFFGFSKLEALAHAGEDLLSRLRDGQAPLDSEMIAALLALVDSSRAILSAIEKGRSEGESDPSELVGRLARLVRKPAAAREGASASGRSFDASLAAAAESSETSIRVDVGLLDSLMDLVGELVLARNHFLRLTTAEKDRSLAAASQRLSLITSELQEEVMRTRLQRIGNVWNKLPRLVRDLAFACGKEVRLEVEGEDIELDRSIIEAIRAPLTHLIRNAVDHGIEAPDRRAALEKPREGTVRLRAFHENGQVNIEVSDDGAGMDPARILDKARRAGFIDAERASQMEDRDVLDVIFLPGFSTAERVTSISGRGVGMDVVKSCIERIGGSVDLDTKVNRGTAIRIKIPLTLAIIPALIVTTGGERFALPLVSLVELVRLDGAEVKTGIEHIRGVPVHRLRGQLLPLVELARELEMAPAGARGCDGDAVNIVVLQAEGRPFGLIVDGVNDTEEIVVKPLGKRLKSISIYAGGTIMGDGKIALILDVAHLARRASVISEEMARARPERPAPPPAPRRAGTSLLLLRTAEGRRMVIPLSAIARLEEFPRSRVEEAGDRRVIQYRGRILPLIPVDELVGERGRAPGRAGEGDGAGSIQVVVYSVGARSVGLVVDRILDIVEESLAIEPTGGRRGVLGTMVIGGRVTEVLDVEGLVRAIDAGPTADEPSEVISAGGALHA